MIAAIWLAARSVACPDLELELRGNHRRGVEFHIIRNESGFQEPQSAIKCLRANSRHTPVPVFPGSCPPGRAVSYLLFLKLLFNDKARYQQRYWPKTNKHTPPLCMSFLQDRS